MVQLDVLRRHGAHFAEGACEFGFDSGQLVLDVAQLLAEIVRLQRDLIIFRAKDANANQRLKSRYSTNFVSSTGNSIRNLLQSVRSSRALRHSGHYSKMVWTVYVFKLEKMTAV